jgi:hypothetical protein
LFSQQDQQSDDENNEEGNNAHVFPTRAELESRKIPQLRELCKKFHVRQGNRKSDMINNLVQRFQTLDNGLSQVNELIEKLATTFQADPPVLHDFYRY